MKYDNIRKAVFLDRPNRFISKVLLDGREQICHVKNTGRCKELLIPGAEVIIQHSDSPGRKTEYDLIAVYKGRRLINIDSSAPNVVFGEFLRNGLFGFYPKQIKAETVHGDSRFDYYFENGCKKCFAEIKGVTLEDNGIVRFPDAPTQRGIKHLNGLIKCVREGYEAWIVFIIQMSDVLYFEPNTITHPQFAEVLGLAQDSGVNVVAYDCNVTENTLEINSPVEIVL